MAEGMPATQGSAEIIPHTDAMLSMIERVACDPNSDIDKLERLYQMRERSLENEARVLFNSAFSKMQNSMPEIDENGAIKIKGKGSDPDKTISTYSLWEDVDAAITPILAEYGFSLSFKTPEAPPGWVYVTSVLRHESGHEDENTVRLPTDNTGSKNATQGVGSSMSYGMRYAATLALKIRSRAKNNVIKDDDGNAAYKGKSVAQSKNDKDWESLIEFMKRDNRSKTEVREWFRLLQQHNDIWRDMPKGWRQIFIDEELTPFVEGLPERIDS